MSNLFYCSATIYESFSILLDSAFLLFLTGNKQIIKNNRIFFALSVFSLIVSIPLFISDGFEVESHVNLSLSILLFSLTSLIFLYFTCLLIAGIISRLKKKKDISESRFACSDILFSKLKNNLKSSKAIKVTFKKRFLLILLPAVSLSYMITVFGVFEFYYANLNDLEGIIIQSFILPMMVTFFIVSIILTLVGLIIFRGASYKAYSAFLSALCIIAYVQNILFNKKQILNGAAFNFKWNNGIFGIINILIWLAFCIAVVFILYKIKKSFPYIIGVSALLLVMQLIPLGVLLIQTPEAALKNKKEVLILDYSNQFEVSSQENVTVFIMDTFAENDLQHLLEKNDKYRSLLSDFISFDNIGSESYFTCFSMPSLLTASNNDYSISLVESNKNNWQSEKSMYFYNTMHENGYSIRFYTDSATYSGGTENMEGKIDNLKNSTLSYSIEKANTYFSMLKLSIYKYSPNIFKICFFVNGADEIKKYTHICKEFDYNYSEWDKVSEKAAQDGVAFYNGDVLNGVRNDTSISDEKICTFMHTFGMHKPFYSDSTLATKDSYDDALEKCMDILMEHIEKLKEAGSYENSTIILTADHGSPFLYKCSPVMLIKPPKHHDTSLSINSSPGILQYDLLPTVLDCIGADSDPIGTSLFKLDKNTNRERFMYEFKYDSDYPECHKITTLGDSAYNCYKKYRYTGRMDEKAKYEYLGTYPITDFWW